MPQRGPKPFSLWIQISTRHNRNAKISLDEKLQAKQTDQNVTGSFDSHFKGLKLEKCPYDPDTFI